MFLIQYELCNANQMERQTEARKELIAQDDGVKLYNTIAKTNILFESGRFMLFAKRYVILRCLDRCSQEPK